MSRLILFLVTVGIAVQGISFYPPIQDGEISINVPDNEGAKKFVFNKKAHPKFSFEGFHLVNNEGVFRNDPFRAMVLRHKIRGLPLMKKSNAFGRTGFRPGKRTMIFDF
ncbi:hypothetical protein B9Z55_023070 [Caenorhabditis nigoni]|uniref:Uncharacterized protein n=1 Tax=Caenorhabditis nigoni TaxID=1611254 RepID=A0A2G5SN00_9PELO|nr:hypothetical protein B9Z55_023070 [Caenorhabditis nigoni]